MEKNRQKNFRDCTTPRSASRTRFKSLLRGDRFPAHPRPNEMSPQTNGQGNGLSPSIEQRTANLVKWTTTLKYSDLPAEVVTRTKSFLLDTLACSIAGQSHPAVQSFLSFAQQMGPKDGKCEYFFAPEKTTSAAFAALVNGAACHVVELDDLNNAGMIHPVCPSP